MTVIDEQEQQDRVYSHLDLGNKQLEPEKDIYRTLINRNFQLGYIDNKEYAHLSLLLEKSFIFMEFDSVLMRKEASLYLNMINSRLVLSGSVGGNVRTSINTHTNINKVTEEKKGGVLSGVFRKSE